MHPLFEYELGPGDLVMRDVVLLEEVVEFEVGDDLGESVVLLDVFGQLGLVCGRVYSVVAVVFLGEVD